MIGIQCPICKHLEQGTDRLRCKAFPKGIPQEILKGQADHRKPYPGDKGIRYKQAGGPL